MKTFGLLVVVLLVSNLYVPVHGALPITLWNNTLCGNGTGISASVLLGAIGTSCSPITVGSTTVYASTSCTQPQDILYLYMYNSSSCDSGALFIGSLSKTQRCSQMTAYPNSGYRAWSAITTATSCNSGSSIIGPSPFGVCMYTLLSLAIIILTV
jgi:hypothetical protein